MKKIILLVCLCINLVTAQKLTKQYKPCTIKSRNGDNVEIPFNTANRLAAVKAEADRSNNALYNIDGKKITFYVFKGVNPSAALLKLINFGNPIDSSEPNDIYVDDNTKGIVVLRRGEVKYESYQSPKSSNYTIVKFDAVLDTIPKQPYYYDFRGDSTRVRKECYDTLRADGKYVPFEHQGYPKGQNVTNNITTPVVDWIKAENFNQYLKFEKNTNDENLATTYRLKLNFNKEKADTIKNNLIYTFYKLKNEPTVYRIILQFNFGCNDRKTQRSANPMPGQINALPPTTIIWPPNKPVIKQPDPTGVGVTPPTQ